MITIEKFDKFVEKLKSQMCGDLKDKYNVDGHLIENTIDKLAKEFKDKN